MKFKNKLTGVILEPKTKSVEEQYKNNADFEEVIAAEADVFKEMTLDQLKEYAAEHKIDIGGATTESGIIKKIKEAEQAG